MASCKRRNGDDEHRCGGGKRPRPAPEKRKQHLYVVLDDWGDKGYRMHKIDVDALALLEEEEAEDMRLPEPALLQFANHAPLTAPMCFSALGTTIFAARPPDTPALLYHADTGGLTIGPPLHVGVVPAVTVAVGGKMYAFHHANQVAVMSLEAVQYANNVVDRMLQPTRAWTWTTLPSPPPYSVLDAITSYAVHPDERTLFISVAPAAPQLDERHYDAELDAWVGLRGGDVCACRVASRSSSGPPEPEWKLLKEKVCGKDPPERQLSVKPRLVHMGGSRFCLLERVRREGVDKVHAFCDSHGCGCVLRLTVFGLKYDHRGELRTSLHRTTASYIVSYSGLLSSPIAFWM
uniref:DUF1618 domain-containing protein n=1 Tax=Oryza brachyantha TaxID=4533 RepID=J3MPD5_ORYBR